MAGAVGLRSIAGPGGLGRDQIGGLAGLFTTAGFDSCFVFLKFSVGARGSGFFGFNKGTTEGSAGLAVTGTNGLRGYRETVGIVETMLVGGCTRDGGGLNKTGGGKEGGKAAVLDAALKA